MLITSEMKYIPGQVHEKLQKKQYIYILNDFNIIICDNFRYPQINTWDDFEKYTKPLKVKKGDIIIIRYYKYSPTTDAYMYLEKVNDIEYKKETMISKKMIDNNNFIFQNVTKSKIRNKKIKKILK
jgi:hypothetical protein